MYLLVRIGLDPKATRSALTATFERRTVHRMESALPPPSNEWNHPFAALAAECHIEADSTAAFAYVAAFYATLGI